MLRFACTPSSVEETHEQLFTKVKNLTLIEKVPTSLRIFGRKGKQGGKSGKSRAPSLFFRPTSVKHDRGIPLSFSYCREKTMHRRRRLRSPPRGFSRLIRIRGRCESRDCGGQAPTGHEILPRDQDTRPSQDFAIRSWNRARGAVKECETEQPRYADV